MIAVITQTTKVTSHWDLEKWYDTSNQRWRNPGNDVISKDPVSSSWNLIHTMIVVCVSIQDSGNVYSI